MADNKRWTVDWPCREVSCRPGEAAWVTHCHREVAQEGPFPWGEGAPEGPPSHAAALQAESDAKVPVWCPESTAAAQPVGQSSAATAP